MYCATVGIVHSVILRDIAFPNNYEGEFMDHFSHRRMSKIRTDAENQYKAWSFAVVCIFLYVGSHVWGGIDESKTNRWG